MKKKSFKTVFSPPLDPLIAPAVELLNKHGFSTYESCQGGEGHAYLEPTVRFFGSEFDLLRAFEICQCYGMAVSEAKRVFYKEDVYKNNNSENTMPFGKAWSNPVNEITFIIDSTTGTIFYDC